MPEANQSPSPSGGGRLDTVLTNRNGGSNPAEVIACNALTSSVSRSIVPSFGPSRAVTIQSAQAGPRTAQVPQSILSMSMARSLPSGSDSFSITRSDGPAPRNSQTRGLASDP